MAVAKYALAPSQVDALKITADNKKTLIHFLGEDTTCYIQPDGRETSEYEKGNRLAAIVTTPDGPHLAVQGDYVMRNECGVYVFRAKDFEKAYVKVVKTKSAPNAGK